MAKSGYANKKDAQKRAAIDESVGMAYSDTLIETFGDPETDYIETPSSISGYKKDKRQKMLCLIGKEVVRIVKEAKLARADRDESVKEWRDLVYMSQPDRVSPMGEDSPNIRTPLTYKHKNAIHAFLLDVSTGVRPFFRTEPDDKDYQEAAGRQEQFIDCLMTEKIDWFDLQDKAISLALDEGISYYFDSYRHETKRVQHACILTPEVAEMHGYILPDDESLWKTGTVVAKEDGTQSRLGFFIEEEADVNIYNGPEVKLISYFDYFQAPANATTPQSSYLCGHVFYETAMSLRRMARSGDIDKEQLEQVFASPSFRVISPSIQTFLNDTGERLSGSGGNTIEDAEDEIEQVMGIEATGQKAPIKAHSVPGDTTGKRSPVRSSAILEFISVCVPIDFNGDDEEEDYMLLVETSSCEVVRVVRLLSSTGRRPYTPLVLFERSNRVFGMPIGQMLENLQISSDESINLALEACILNLTSVVTEEKSSENRTTMKQLRAGFNHRLVDKAESIKVQTFPQNTRDAFIDSAKVDSMAEQVTAISETFAGQSTKGDQTATEVQQQAVNAARRIKVAARRMQRQSRIVAKAVREQCRQNVGLLFPKLASGNNGKIAFGWESSPGEWSFGEIDPLDLFAPVAIFAHGDEENTNEVLKRQGAEKLWMMMERDSDFMGMTFERKWNVRKFVLEAYGVRNIANFIGSRKDAIDRDKEAAKNPAPQMPPLPPNANAEFAAAFCLMNPALADQFIQILTKVSQAENAGKAGGDPNGEMLDQQLDQATDKIKHEQDMAKMKLSMAGEKERMQTDVHKAKAGMELAHAGEMQGQELSHQAEMQQMELGRSADEHKMALTHDSKMQSEKGKAQTDKQKTDIKHTTEVEKQKQAALRAKKPASTGGRR